MDATTSPLRLLLVVAHPDDETFGCGSLLAEAADCGYQTIVACATLGEAGEIAPGRGLDGLDIAELREAELRQAAALLGVTHVELLDWTDSGMEGDPAPASLVAAALDEVAGVVCELVDRYHPTIVVTLDASDGHRDHAHIRDATLDAVQRSTWQVELVYLHCLPRRLMREWAAALTVANPGSEYLALGELGTPEEAITTVIDSDRWYELRCRAIEAHRSQSSPYEVMPAELKRQFLTNECLQRVRPIWTGGDVERQLPHRAPRP